MRILIQHLTAVGTDYFCAAGICLDGDEVGRTVRLVPVDPRKHFRSAYYPIRLLASHGGPFDMAAILDCSQLKPVGEPPSVEDYLAHEPDLKPAGGMWLQPDLFWNHLASSVQTCLTSVFGAALQTTRKRSAWLPSRTGVASLGILSPKHINGVRIAERMGSEGLEESVRISFEDVRGCYDLPLNDLRLYRSVPTAPCQEEKEAKSDIDLLDELLSADSPIDTWCSMLNARLKLGKSVLLGVGLTRPYKHEYGWRCWVQATNIHFESKPTWRMGEAI